MKCSGARYRFGPVDVCIRLDLTTQLCIDVLPLTRVPIYACLPCVCFLNVLTGPGLVRGVFQ
jgi:hypothetical protein